MVRSVIATNQIFLRNKFCFRFAFFIAPNSRNSIWFRFFFFGFFSKSVSNNNGFKVQNIDLILRQNRQNKRVKHCAVKQKTEGKKPVQFISLTFQYTVWIIIDIGSWKGMEKPALIRYALNIGWKRWNLTENNVEDVKKLAESCYHMSLLLLHSAWRLYFPLSSTFLSFFLSLGVLCGFWFGHSITLQFMVTTGLFYGQILQTPIDNWYILSRVPKRTD